MTGEGWTWSDLAGELWARGIDPDEVSNDEVARVLGCPSPEAAAREIDSGPTMADYMSLPRDVRRYGR